MTNTDKCRDCGRHLQPADEGDPEGPWVDDDGDRTCDVTGIDHWLFDPNEPHHITSSRINEWPQASMLRQVALVRDFGDSVPTATDLLTCENCDWHDTAATHEESMTKRVAHEANPA
jgi:hypothetical protein